MPDIVIRPARLDDAPALIALDTVAAGQDGRAEDIVSWIAHATCLVAVLDGAPAGYAVLTGHFFNQPMLEMLMVAASSRRQGVGECLVRHAIDATEARLWTSTNQSNLAMQALLDRLGFVRSGFVEGLDEGDPELIYRKDIATVT